MFQGLYLIGFGMFLIGIVFGNFTDDAIIKKIACFFIIIGLLSFPLITIAYGIKLIINN